MQIINFKQAWDKYCVSDSWYRAAGKAAFEALILM